MDIKVVDANNKPVEGQEVPNPETLDVPFRGELEIKAISDVLGLNEHESIKYSDKISTLLEYAKMKTDDHSPEGLKWAIRSLGYKLNTPNIGEKMIDYMSRFAYLELEGKKIEKEKEKYYE